MDSALEEASRASGASLLQTVRRVTLPILLPGMLAVLMLSVVIILGQFEVPLLFGVGVGAKIFNLRIWLALRSPLGLPEYGLAGAYALHFMLLAYLLFFAYARLTRVANKYATVTGKGYRPSQMRLGGWNYAAWAGISLYWIVAFVFPLFTLVWASLFRYFVPVTGTTWSALLRLMLTARSSAGRCSGQRWHGRLSLRPAVQRWRWSLRRSRHGWSCGAGRVSPAGPWICWSHRPWRFHRR